jgi:hypothetical protein
LLPDELVFASEPLVLPPGMVALEPLLLPPGVVAPPWLELPGVVVLGVVALGVLLMLLLPLLEPLGWSLVPPVLLCSPQPASNKAAPRIRIVFFIIDSLIRLISVSHFLSVAIKLGAGGFGTTR